MNVLDRKVLVLNKSWVPIAVVNLDRAICLCVGTHKGTNEPKAKILDVYQDYQSFTWQDWSNLIAKSSEPTIKTAKQEFKIPEIIILSRYNKFPKQKIHFCRRALYKRDGFQCKFCGDKPGSALLNIEHILPRSRGGLTTWENCCIACIGCNTRKGNRTMEEIGFTFFDAKYKPHKPKFAIYDGDVRCDSWKTLLGEMYWRIELQNDN